MCVCHIKSRFSLSTLSISSIFLFFQLLNIFFAQKRVYNVYSMQFNFNSQCKLTLPGQIGFFYELLLLLLSFSSPHRCRSFDSLDIIYFCFFSFSLSFVFHLSSVVVYIMLSTILKCISFFLNLLIQISNG